MSSLLSSPEPVRLAALPAPVADPGYLKVVVAFDDQAAYRRALKLCVRVCSELEEGLRVQPLPWTPDYLGRSDWPPISPRQAAEADIVVVAASEPEEVPAVVLAWVEQCCAQPRTAAGLLVALLGDSGDDDSNSFLAEGLRAIAARTHFAYLAPEHLGDLPVGRDLAPRPPRAAPRRAVVGCARSAFALPRGGRRRSVAAPMVLELPPGEFAGYIFDLDGTLVDTMPLHFRAWAAAMREAGLRESLDENLFYALGGVPTRKVAELFAAHYRLTIDPEAVFHRKEALFLELQAEVRVIEPVAAIARRAAGVRPVAIASGGPRPIVERSLAITGLAPLFPVVVTADDVTHGKPSPDMFLLAAQQMGVAPADCLVFEDAEPGIRAAEAAGMRWVRVPSRPAAPSAAVVGR